MRCPSGVNSVHDVLGHNEKLLETALGYFESLDCVGFKCDVLFGSGHPRRRDVIPLRLWEADGPESFPNTNTGILHIPASFVA